MQKNYRWSLKLSCVPDLIKSEAATANAKGGETGCAAGDQEDDEGGVEDVVEGEDGLGCDEGKVQRVGKARVVKRVAIPQRRVYGSVNVGEDQGEGEEEGEKAEEDAHPQLERSADLLAPVHQAARPLLQISLLSLQQPDLLLEPVDLALLEPGHLQK